MSSILPGSGQIYNEKHRKTVIIYAGIGTSIYYANNSQNKYLIYKQEYLERIKENGDIKFNKNIRIGGMVKKGSIEANQNEIRFIITDFKSEIIVSYRGAVPALFAEGKGVVAEGKLQDKKFFLAKRILAKHDENYMPPDVAEALALSEGSQPP